MKILITESNGYSKEAISIYESIGEVILGHSNLEIIEKNLPSTDILVIKLNFNFGLEHLEKAKNLKFIVTSTTGTNHIILPKNSEIKIVSLQNETEFLKNITPTAELTWALILALHRKLTSSIESVKNGEWSRDKFIGEEIKGKKIGILGLGRIGQMVGKIAKAFEMEVLFFDKEGKVLEGNDAFKNVSLDRLFLESDILTIHIPSSKDNIGFVNKNLLSKMKVNSYLINTSRGDVLDEEFLLEMLAKKKISGAALDVLSDEILGGENWTKINKLINSDFLGKNLLITPHIGGACKESMKKTENFVANKLRGLVNSLK